MSANEWTPKVGERVIVQPSGADFAGEVGRVAAVYTHPAETRPICVVLPDVSWGVWFHPDELAPFETEQKEADRDGAE